MLPSCDVYQLACRARQPCCFVLRQALVLRTTVEPVSVPAPDDGSRALVMQSAGEGTTVGATGSFEPASAEHVQGTSPPPVDDSGKPAARPVVGDKGVAAFSQQEICSMLSQGVDTGEAMPAAQLVAVPETVAERGDNNEQVREDCVLFGSPELRMHPAAACTLLVDLVLRLRGPWPKLVLCAACKS